MSLSPQISGVILAIAGASLFSLKPIFIKLAYQYSIEPLTLLTLRMAISLPFYLIIGFWVVRCQQANLPRLWPDMVQIGMLGVLGYYLASYLDLLGLMLTTAQLERLILFAYPTLVVVFGALFFGQKVPSGAPSALLMTYSGIAIIFLHDVSTAGVDVIRGGLLIFVSAVCFAFFLLASKAFILKMGSRLYTCLAMSASSFAILIHFFFTQSVEQLFVPIDLFKIVFCIAVVSTVLPSFLVNAAIYRIGSGRTGIAGSIGPVVTALLSVIILGESFTISHFFGLILVIVGIYQISIKH